MSDTRQSLARFAKFLLNFVELFVVSMLMLGSIAVLDYNLGDTVKSNVSVWEVVAMAALTASVVAGLLVIIEIAND